MTDHAHDWYFTRSGEDTWYACTECDATSPVCGTCERRPTGSSLLICDRCLTAERRVLDDIDHALAHYQEAPPVVLKAVRYDTDRIDGTPGDYQDDPTAIATPADVMDVLASWAQAWADALGYVGVLGYPGDTPPPLEFLRQHVLWAAQNPDASGWVDYRGEARQLRHHARRIAGLLPARALAPCIHCNGQVVQDWADKDWQPRMGHRPEDRGLSDVLRCTGCGTTWGDRDTVTSLAVRGKIHTRDYHPDGHVTEAQARRMFDLGTSTIRLWVRRGKVRHIARDTAGRKLYRVGDLQQLAEPTLVETTG